MLGLWNGECMGQRVDSELNIYKLANSERTTARRSVAGALAMKVSIMRLLWKESKHQPRSPFTEQSRTATHTCLTEVHEASYAAVVAGIVDVRENQEKGEKKGCFLRDAGHF